MSAFDKSAVKAEIQRKAEAGEYLTKSEQLAYSMMLTYEVLAENVEKRPERCEETEPFPVFDGTLKGHYNPMSLPDVLGWIREKAENPHNDLGTGLTDGERMLLSLDKEGRIKDYSEPLLPKTLRELEAEAEDRARSLHGRLKLQQELNKADPWAHRSEGMRCSTCMWFVVKHDPDKPDDMAIGKGRCRRHAPTMNGYPVVFHGDWCGDHKLK